MTMIARHTVAIAAFSLAALLFDAGPAGAQTTGLYFDSQPGDEVSGGTSATFLPADGWSIAARGTLGGPASPRVEGSGELGSGPGAPSFRFSFAAPGSTPLTVGPYEHAIRDTVETRVPGIFFTRGTDCAAPGMIGRFVVYEIEYEGDVLTRFAVDFEVRCTEGAPSMFAAFRFNAHRGTLLPFDGDYPRYELQVGSAQNGHVAGDQILCGAGFTQCQVRYALPTDNTVTATPNPGYVFVGWIGDCFGTETATVTVNRLKQCTPVFGRSPGTSGGEDPSYAARAIAFESPTGSALYPETKQVHAATDQDFFWISGGLAPPQATGDLAGAIIAAVQRGYGFFMVTMRMASGQPFVPGVYQAAGDGFVPTSPFLTVAGCSAGGRFQVYEADIDGTVVNAFAADFEVPCGEEGQMLRGVVRYNSSRQRLSPFATEPLPPPPLPPTCQTPDPFVSLGGGTCFNGGWLAPGMPIPDGGSPAPVPTPPTPPPPAHCTTPDPFAALGGGTCFNGGWLPPGMPIPAGGSPTPTPPPPPPGPTACVGPDPFASLPTLVGVCINGGWVPVPRG